MTNKKEKSIQIKVNEKEILNIQTSLIAGDPDKIKNAKNQIRESAYKLLALIGEAPSDTSISEKEPEQKQIGIISMSTGILWLGEAKNIIIDRLHERKEDLGVEFYDLENKLEERSGENDLQKETLSWLKEQDRYIINHPKWKAFIEKYGKDAALPAAGTLLRKKMENLTKTLEDEFSKENPLQIKSIVTRAAQFYHDDGSEGMGMAVRTPERDSNYPIIATYRNGRISTLTIDMSKEETDQKDAI